MDADRPIRVCVVSPLYHTSLGGVGRQALALTERLESLGTRVFVIARRMKGLPVCAFSHRIPLYRAWAFNPHKHDLEEMSLSNLAISLSFCVSTAMILFRTRREYDIVHFHGASLPLVMNILPLKLYRKKVLAKVAAAKLGVEAGSLKGKYCFLGEILTWILRKTDCFIATSEEIEEGLLVDAYDQTRIVRIPNFIDQSMFYPSDDNSREQIRARLGPQYRKIVTYSGRLVERKGINVLLEAWEKLMKDGRDSLLMILGGGPLEEKLKDQARTLGIEENVKFCGFVDNIGTYLAVTDVFVFPSFQEGFPNAVLEAMGCGLPVVSTKIGGVTDVIRHGENGLLVKSGNVNELAHALRRLISDTEYASHLGKNALKTVRENYDLNVIAEKYVALYERLMKGY